MLYPLAYAPVRLPDPDPDGALSLADLLHLLTPGKRLVWSDGAARATFVLRAGPALGGQQLTVPVQGGGIPVLYSWERGVVYAVQAAAALDVGDTLREVVQVAVMGYPTGGAVGALLADARCRGTELQVELGQVGGQASAGSWYQVFLAFRTAFGRRVECALAPIGCPA
jgi:hypothetical protein